MAFMMPVMKNNYDIYKCNGRSRKSSESSQRSRKVSESKSEGGSRSRVQAAAVGGGGSLGSSPAHRSVPAMMGARGPGIAHHRALRPVRSLSCSTNPAQGTASPTPPATPAPQDKLHTRLLDKLKRTLLRKDRDGSPPGDQRDS